MKKLMKALLLVGLFISYAATNTNAQTVDNNTSCDFIIAVAYADGFCNNTGYETLTVQAGTSANLNIPPGSRIVASKGAPVALSSSPFGCVYYIGRPACVSYPMAAFVTCGPPCGNYVASLNASFSTITIN